MSERTIEKAGLRPARPAPVSALCSVWLRIAPDRFHHLKFILEGYDNLAILSSGGEPGLVRLRCARESMAELFALVGAMAPELRIYPKISRSETCMSRKW